MSGGEGFAAHTANSSHRALLYEVGATPKPGLVDRHDSGAHTDMDFFTFVESACALQPYFYTATTVGLAHKESPAALLALLRPHGIQAEEAMLRATGGVNTHKGLVYSMGILCAAAGWLHGQGRNLTTTALCGTAAQIAAADTTTALHGLPGARGEAAAGFPAVRLYGLPTLTALVEQGFSLNDGGAITLLHLLAHVEDTNIVARAGHSALKEVQAETRALLAACSERQLLREAERLNRAFIRQNISPGGCADLLAVSYLLLFLCERPGEAG